MFTMTALFTSATVGMSQSVGTSYAQSQACSTGERPQNGQYITEPNISKPLGLFCPEPSVLVDGKCESKLGRGPGSLQ
jgi:hypothetical protein